MKKILALTFLVSTFVHAGLVNAISVIVNDEAITLYDVDTIMQEKQINKNQALEYLIDEVLYKQQLKEKKISVDTFELDEYMEKIAQSNGMDLYTFRSVVKQQYGSFERFEQETKKRLLQQKLTQAIVRGNLKVATDEDMRIYYENNFHKYNLAYNIRAIKYTSVNKGALELLKSNPMLQRNDIKKELQQYQRENLSDQMKYLLNETKQGSFSPIVSLGNEFAMFYIRDKKDFKVMPFEEVKEKIFETLMKQREQKYLKEHFEKLKLTSKIKIIR